MTELLTAAQMRSLEQAAIESGEVTGLELMERAGRGVVEAIFEEWPELRATSHRAVVLCGPGNNGGDGFVVARLLKEWGWEVEVFLYGDPEKLPPDARVNYERWREVGDVLALNHETPELSISEPDLIIDALFGTGLTRPISAIADLILDLNEEVLRARAFSFPNCRVTAIDLPSGLCNDSGRRLADGAADRETRWFKPTCLMSQLTVTFHSRKLGHVIAEGPEVCGKVVEKDIGLDRSNPRRKMVWQQGENRALAAHLSEIVRCLDGAEFRPVFAYAEDRLGKTYPGEQTHKFTHGHALILSGRSGKGGSARLAARGALRIGAGLVTVAPTPGAMQENAARLDAVMLVPVGGADDLATILEDTRINAICLGPGLGVDRAADLVPVALEKTRPGPRAGAPATEERSREVPGRARDGGCVLDADALTALARDDVLFGMLHPGCVLTPHGGEFARLFPDIAERLAAPATKGPAYSKVEATREAAARAGCVVLFKGPDTVIADPDGRCAINSSHYERSAPWLATAGSGDVLAGFIAGLLARGFPPMQAAETAAWLHTECALSFGPGLIAEDLPEELPKVFRRLGL